MTIKSFKANSVFGYLDFDIKFNNDISFLVGGNGSGKTTALKLMNALVSPNFKELLKIPFKYCALEISTDVKDITISAETIGEEIHLLVNDVEEPLVLHSLISTKFDYISHREEKIDEFVDDMKRRNSDHPVLVAIANIVSPIFLGLDRRRDTSDIKQDYFHEREMWLHQKRSKGIAASRRFINGSIGASLMDTEMLVQNSYRRIRELESKQANRLRDKILLSSFQFSKFESSDFERNINEWKEKEIILARKREINEAILNIVGKDSALSNEVNNFFSEITKLFDIFQNMDKNKNGVVVEWLLNKAQIERMFSIVEIIDEHKSKIDRYYKPINDFIKTINNYYKDSNKVIKVDAVGQLIVKRPDGNECTIEALSSGERQLLVIFAHAFFNRHSHKKNIFIIDEPELSLHLRWQENFAETIFSINPNSQYILATHSPEIVAGNKNKSVKCR